MPSHPKRFNGFSKPHNQHQFYAPAGTIVAAILFYVMAGLGLSGAQLTMALSLYSGAFSVSVALWLATSLIDPSKPGGCPFPCFKDQVEGKMRYDREMGKNIPGLDHHCKWLNTAIGTRNYALFFFLILTLFIQFTLQLIFGLLLMTVWAPPGFPTYGYVLTVLYELVVAVIAYPVTNLLQFHFRLMCMGLSTYEWIMKQAKAKTAVRKAAMQKNKAAVSGAKTQPVSPAAVATAPPTVVSDPEAQQLVNPADEPDGGSPPDPASDGTP